MKKNNETYTNSSITFAEIVNTATERTISEIISLTELLHTESDKRVELVTVQHKDEFERCILRQCRCHRHSPLAPLILEQSINHVNRMLSK